MERQLKKLSLSGVAMAILLTIAPNDVFAMHIMEGFLPPMWALAWWMLFLPCLFMGLVRLKQIVAEDSNQKSPVSAVRCLYFRVIGTENPIGDRQLFASDRRRASGYSVWAGSGGGVGGHCAAVPGVITGARRSDNLGC
ncbi:substrate-specific component CbiM of cobalt ECF transporter [Yersinia enterocolitica subsp. palearctica Y11]|uniref:Substrate-specific component CbiM of cobalt ECF transporter n=1 Tax=Yersinia enterocolitica subsp. palearctica serotype O:3 (strain DSM 13030 / CIP 106945 / Y11) TaxID=930944 RepID=A0A0H3NNB5_YERE1|nr:substrate-specific component CbiM of cobalt ECF transporter [Yersinia enterocolitica subsp. palearctica Y11]